MSKSTMQMQEWSGNFGREYTDRNVMTLEEMECLYKKRYGIGRTDMNAMFIGGLKKNISILEVGSNIGNQLLCLQKAGFKNLYGIDIQSHAIKLSRSRIKSIDIVQGSALGLPFEDGIFDLVFTSGVLIHLAPENIGEALYEIYRCTKKYIWCFEYYADTYTQIKYHRHDNLLWKTDFAKLFIQRFKDLQLVKEKRFSYLDNNNIDSMFMLMKAK